jgi:hypothetical protein
MPLRDPLEVFERLRRGAAHLVSPTLVVHGVDALARLEADSPGRPAHHVAVHGLGLDLGQIRMRRVDGSRNIRAALRE